MGFFDRRALKKYTKEAEIVMSYEANKLKNK